MASYKLVIKRSAAKELEAVRSRKDRRRIVVKIRSLAVDPRPPGCQKLSGSEKYRVRQGSYRIVYSIEDGRLVVTVVRIAHRIGLILPRNKDAENLAARLRGLERQ